MDRNQKAETVATVNRALKGAQSVVVAHYAGLNAAEVFDLRRRVREAGAAIKVAKNRLVKRALEGTAFVTMGDLLKGPTALTYSKDPVAAAKVCVEYARKNDKLVILGGAMAGTRLDAEGIKALASLPSLDELRGKIVGLLQAPATKIAGVLQAPAGQLA
ncbi:MAG: 50S ribosomal protein L10, partial [Alphaproteobacteria bacterium]|nr:50S ribosomal protein L10 [Alphaproteobacteria bacterium]